MTYMLMDNEEAITNEWQKYHGYTVRPLPSLVAYYQKIIQDHLFFNKFLLFGGTPEIRSIFQQLKRNVLLVDRSALMLKAMGKLTNEKKAIADNEIVLQKDWLEQGAAIRHMQCILGDDAINMLPWHKFEAFIRNAYRMLTDNGLFICHLLVKPDESLIDKNFSSILKEFKQGLIKSKYDLASRLNFICFDKNSYAMSWQKTITDIGHSRLALFKPTLDFADTFGLCNSQFYCPPQVEFEKLAKKYFCIEEIFYAHEHEYCVFEPVYLFRKRNNHDITH